MKKKILLIAVLFLGATFMLTGCGSTNKLVTALNKVVDNTVESWKEKGNVTTITISGIQGELSNINENYYIIATGNKEFEKSAISTIYTTDIDDYKGVTYGSIRAMLSENDVNYAMVYDSEENAYYNIEISYKTVKINDTEKEYPHFSNASEIE